LAEICDIDIEKAIKAFRTWNITAYSGLEHKIWRWLKFDVAVVSTPDDAHYEILKELAKCPLKLVICEKPLCTDLNRAREIVELYRAKGTPLLVNYTRRFLPYYEDLKERYEAMELGCFIGGNIVFNRGWLHTGTHIVDFLNWFFDDYSWVNRAKNIKINSLNWFEKYRIWQIDLFFEKYHWREERIGDMPVWDYYDKAMRHVVNNAYEFLEGREELRCSGEDALRTLEICFELMGGANKT